VQRKGNAMRESFINTVINSPFCIQEILLFLGNLLLLCLAVWMLAIYVLKLRKLFWCSGESDSTCVYKENNLAFVLGWIGFGAGVICTWCSLHATCSKCCSMLEGNMEVHLVANVFMSSFMTDIRPFMLGCLVLIFSQFVGRSPKA